MKNLSDIRAIVPEPNDRSKRDFEYSIQISRLVSTPIGLWPLDLNANLLKRFFFEFFLITVCCSLICFFVISCGLQVILVDTKTRNRIRFLGPVSFCFMALAKYAILISRREKIRNCLRHIDIDWRRVNTINHTDDRKIMLTSAATGRFIGCASAAFMYSGGLVYRTLVPLTVGSIITPDNVTIRPLIFRVYEPFFGGINSPSYEFCFTEQWFSGFVGYSIAISTCSLTAVFVLHACGQLKIVRDRLNNLVGGRRDGKCSVEDRIAQIVELHLRVLGFIFRTERILNEICLIDFVGCTANMCLLGYYFVMLEYSHTIAPIPVLAGLLLLTSFTFNIFVLCYIGEMLTQQSQLVGTTAYMIDWYELPCKSARDLILLLAISNYSSSITAGRMVALSYATFTSVVKTAVANFNFMRTMIR